MGAYEQILAMNSYRQESGKKEEPVRTATETETYLYVAPLALGIATKYEKY